MKQYAFWRTPHGDPSRGDMNKNAPNATLAFIGSKAFITPEGKVAWHDFSLMQMESVIRSAVVIIDPDEKELSATDAWEIVRPAMADVIRKKGGGHPIDASALLKEANKRAAKFFLTGPSQYVLLASLSVKPLPLKSLSVNGCTIRPLRERGKRFPVPELLSFEASRLGLEIDKSKYTVFRVNTTGRTIVEAANRALDALNLLRGYLNLFATRGKWVFGLGNSPNKKPMGVIHAGPFFTLHHPDGTLVDDVYWFSSDISPDRELFEPKNGWDALLKNYKRATKRVRSLPFRFEIENLISRYAIALDQSNWDMAFLQMWSILETLTDTVGKKYDDTISRASWIYDDVQVAQEMLSVLRFRRNQLVHAAQSGDENDQVAYMIKSFIDPHLWKLIKNDFKVRDFEEYGTLLGLPRNLETLEKRQQPLKKAIRLIRKWESKNEGITE